MPKGWLSGELLTWLWLLILTSLVNGIFGSSLLNSSGFPLDTITKTQDSIVLADTLNKNIDLQDTTRAEKQENNNRIEDLITRDAKDSIVQDLPARKVYMYGDAVIKYEDITLKAAFIEVDFNKNTVFATYVVDSTGKKIGIPEFTQGKETFKAKSMTYDFKTEKGVIKNVLTENSQGFLHGKKVKKMHDNTINVLHGSYTTCNLEENPHFAFKFKKARVIPNNKIVTGPVYMEIEGVPTPLVLPFGIFPNQTGHKSGIVLPSYGESADRGYFLENGGYYWAINDHMDFQVLGDIYSRGSWAIKPRFRYKNRYRYQGTFDFGYAVNVVGTKDAPDYSKSSDFRIRWTHSQDPKARPRSSFSANVNIVTSNYVKYNVVSTQDYLSNQFNSSIAYQTNWAGKYFLTLNSKFNENTKNRQISFDLPSLTFTVNRFYPLRRKEGGGKKRFYEDLSISYTMNARNTVNTLDSLLFKSGTIEKEMQNGAIHKVPISLPVRVLKYFTWSNSINTTDRMYTESSKLYYDPDTLIIGNDTLPPGVRSDTLHGFYNAFDFSLSSSLSTKVYGMLRFKKGPIRAIRHVFTPSISFSYVPDFGSENWGYYQSYVDENGNEVKYSKFNNQYFSSIIGGPPGNKSGRIGFNFGNSLEMKVRSRKDTITGTKKIKLIESFNISGSYDLAADSLNFSFLNMNGRTRLWKNFVIQYSSNWDPYAADASGKRINKYEWEVHNKLFRMDNTVWSLSLGLQLANKDFKKKAKEKPKEATANEWNEIKKNPEDYVDWSIPWSLNLNYTFQYSNNPKYINYGREDQRKVVQTLALNGQINITPKWKFTFRTGWDFTHNEVSYTSINLYRDLHCWEMRFNWVPLGPRKSWNFSINVKASILQDLKLNRKNDWRDN